MLTFNEMLERDGFDQSKIVVFRHRPMEPELNRNFDWIVAERPDLFDCYQNTHNQRTESALKRAGNVASFLRHGPGEALLVGLFRINGWTDLTSDQWESRPQHRELVKLGMAGASGGAWRETISEFKLEETDYLHDWKRRLIIKWPGLERSWYRWADRNVFEINAIAKEDVLQPEMPNWQNIRLSHEQLTIVPASWGDALRHWRGIYLIVDEMDRRCYVWSAGGKENLLQRWLEYGRTGHGGNKHLRKRDPTSFRFSILQRVSPDLPQDELVVIENSWKKRIGSYWPDGLNEN